MRALCGAIITAAALIGMGLTAQGIGTRYQVWEPVPTRTERSDKEGEASSKKVAEVPRVQLHNMDRPLVFTLAFLTLAALIGLGVTFVGLAYHHHRREREYQLAKERAGVPPRMTV